MSLEEAVGMACSTLAILMVPELTASAGPKFEMAKAYGIFLEQLWLGA